LKKDWFVMKTRAAALIAILLCAAHAGCGLAGQTDMETAIEGIWLGTLQVPGANLRIAITISETPSNTYQASMTSIDQGSGELPMNELVLADRRLLVKATDLGVEIEGIIDVENGLFDAEFRQGPGKFPLLFRRVDALPTLSRPQEPKRPFPYLEEEVEYENSGAGVTLAATLTYPNSGGPFPAVVLLTGSGPQNRDEELFGHKPFLVLSDYLTRRGIAVLRADDRGVGGSGGDFKTCTTADFAGDALAGVEYLMSRKEIDPKRIGLVGHSEGGMMAPIAASQSSDVAFIVLMAAPGTPFGDVILFQKMLKRKNAGVSEEGLMLHRTWMRRVYEIAASDVDDDTAAERIRSLYADLSETERASLGKTADSVERDIAFCVNPWRRYAFQYDAQAVLMQVPCPVLAINGAKDMQVPSQENLAGIRAALEAGGNHRFLVKELADLNHLFQTANTGEESEYNEIDETISPHAMQTISAWIKNQTVETDNESVEHAS
jgi:pimeloyl-ACP methyl ester carboxylesterase